MFSPLGATQQGIWQAGDQAAPGPMTPLFTNPAYTNPIAQGLGGIPLPQMTSERGAATAHPAAFTPTMNQTQGVPVAPGQNWGDQGGAIHAPQMRDPKVRTPEYGMNVGGWGWDGSQAGSQFQTSTNNGQSWQQSNPQTQDNPWNKPGAWGQSDNGAAPGTYTRK